MVEEPEGHCSPQVARCTRNLALQTLLFVLAIVQQRGAAAPDERTASTLLAMACSLAVALGSGPRQLEGASRLAAVAAACDKAPVQLQLARLVLALRAACFHVRPADLIRPIALWLFFFPRAFLTMTFCPALQEASSWGSVRVAAGLMLSDCLMLQLGATVQCPGLLQLVVPLQVLRQSVGELHLSSAGAGSVEQPMPCLVASADLFSAGSLEGDDFARAGEEALRAAHSGWASAYTKALQKVCAVWVHDIRCANP